MTLKKLMTSAAALALTATMASASGADYATAPNPNAPANGVEGGTEFNGELVDKAAELQNAETLDRQNPQAVDPVYDLSEADMETIETFQAVEGKNGSEVILQDGTLIGTLLEMDIDNAGKGEMTVDVSDSNVIDGDAVVITTGPENVMISGGMLVIASTTEEMSNLAGGDQGARDGYAQVYLN